MKGRTSMVVALIGESCTGKTTIAEELKGRTEAEIFAGKDYLRMGKSPSAAEKSFKEYLEQNQGQEKMIVYLISEIDELKFLPSHAVKIRCQAPLEIIKERFAERMRGNLPPQVADMLERKYGMFQETVVDLSYDTTQRDVGQICEKILKYCRR